MQGTIKPTTQTVASRNARRKRFRAALSLAGKTQAAFADSIGYGAHHLSRALKGKAPASAALLAEIDAFIAKHLGETRAA